MRAVYVKWLDACCELDEGAVGALTGPCVQECLGWLVRDEEDWIAVALDKSEEDGRVRYVLQIPRGMVQTMLFIPGAGSTGWPEGWEPPPLPAPGQGPVFRGTGSLGGGKTFATAVGPPCSVCNGTGLVLFRSATKTRYVPCNEGCEGQPTKDWVPTRSVVDLEGTDAELMQRDWVGPRRGHDAVMESIASMARHGRAPDAAPGPCQACQGTGLVVASSRVEVEDVWVTRYMLEMCPEGCSCHACGGSGAMARCQVCESQPAPMHCGEPARPIVGLRRWECRKCGQVDNV